MINSLKFDLDFYGLVTVEEVLGFISDSYWVEVLATHGHENHIKEFDRRFTNLKGRIRWCGY